MSERTPSASLLEAAPSAMSRQRASRVGQVSPNKRPPTPRFLAPGLTAPPSFRPIDRVLPTLATTTGTAGPSKLRESRNHIATNTAREGEPSRGSKRAAVDCIDLTATTEPDARSSAQKRIRTATTTARPPTAATAATHDARAKSKAAKKERAEQHEKMTAESITWRMKYKKAFPSFVFYFDALDPATELSLIKSVEYLGANVDNFFSKKVTHVITSRAVPPAAVAKENLPSPSFNSHNAPRNSLDKAADASTGPARTQKGGRKSPLSYSFLNGQKLPQYTDVLEKNPFIDSQDILSKASEFGLKIWRTDKAQRIISRMNSYSPTKADANPARTLSLPSLLRDEQLFGTRERDPFVPRADTHYFSAKSCYVLVEDSIGEHRPIVVKEYTKPRKGEDPAWPVLYGGIEGRGGFYHYEGAPIVYPTKQRPRPTPRLNVLGAPNLRRTLSLDQFHKKAVPAKAFDPAQNLKIGGKVDDYIAASGNSQIITSNTGTSTRSGAMAQLGGKGYVDKRLAVLSRKSIALGGQVGGVVQGKLKRTASVDTGLNERAPPAREEPKKPGYCENCRNKYDDFKEHAVSRRHLKFARNPDNWVELDVLLGIIARPRLPVHNNFSSDPEADSDEGEEDSGFYDASQEEKDEEEDDDDAADDDEELVGDEREEEEEDEEEEEEE